VPDSRTPPERKAVCGAAVDMPASSTASKNRPAGRSVGPKPAADGGGALSGVPPPTLWHRAWHRSADAGTHDQIGFWGKLRGRQCQSATVPHAQACLRPVPGFRARPARTPESRFRRLLSSIVPEASHEVEAAGMRRELKITCWSAQRPIYFQKQGGCFSSCPDRWGRSSIG
jgi:hypothetical protein